MSRPAPISAPADPAHSRSAGVLPVLAWGVFLAASWTWVIGMFLPVLLVRDYGVAGFVVFAIPNVLGAAAMGWVLARPRTSEQILASHGLAAAGFSLVTAAFQVFFLVWLLTFLGSAQWPAVLLSAGGFTLAAGLLRTRSAGRVALAAVVYAASVAIGLTLLARGSLSLPDIDPVRSTRDLLWLAPVVLFGFALCPYLDLTFHRARQRLPGAPGVAAFAVGFGAFFLAMILLTLGYAHLLLPMAGVGERGAVAAPALGLVGAHIIAQLFLTVDLHMRELGERTRAPSLRAALIVAGVLAPALLGVITLQLPAYAGLSAPEVLYRAFMAFYGLIFPAYVWLCMIPARGDPAFAPPTREKLRVFAFAVGVAAPMFWLGFMHRQEIWLAPGLLLVLAARLALPKPRK